MREKPKNYSESKVAWLRFWAWVTWEAWEWLKAEFRRWAIRKLA
jgi:hypothetical protein